jgi:ceramide glucosyltransferase
VKAILALRYASRYAASYAARYPKPRTEASATDLSAATIVQPILSGDPDLPAALADNLTALPEAGFLWLIDDDDAEAAAIASRLRNAHPSHRIDTIVCAAAADGVNPKLFKLERARSEVTRGVFVVVDDDTRVTREGMAALLAALDTHTLATGLPCYLDRRRDLASRLLAQFVNNNAALTYLPLLAFAAPPTINGMTYAMTPASLDAMGGFAPLSRHLADDLAVARRVIRTGGSIHQTPVPQFVATSVRDLAHYRALMHRWFVFALLLLREQPASLRLAIGLLLGLPPLLLWTMLIAAGSAPTIVASVRSLLAALAVLALRAITLIVVQRSLTGRSRYSPLLSIVSELLQPLHLLHALVSRRIIWRTRRYIVRANDDFRAV